MNRIKSLGSYECNEIKVKITREQYNEIVNEIKLELEEEWKGKIKEIIEYLEKYVKE